MEQTLKEQIYQAEAEPVDQKPDQNGIQRPTEKLAENPKLIEKI